MLSPSSEATCGSDDFEPTNPPPQINVFWPDTNDQVTKAKSDDGKIGAFSSFNDSTTAASPGLSEPIEGPAVVANPQSVHDEPIYNIGMMKIYDQTQKAIPKLYEARWQVIRPDIFDRVHKRLKHGRFAARFNKHRNPAIIELMSAGVNKACSMPAVLVVIPRHTKKMQDFLNTDSTVQNRCKPEDGTTVELLALACKGSSTLIGMPNDPLGNVSESQSDSNSEFLSGGDDSFTEGSMDDSDSSPGLHTSTTSGVLEVDPQSVSVIHDPNYVAGDVKHGMGIRVITKDGSQYVRGTCGGLLQLLVPNQPPRQVGLMAAHLLEQLGQDSKEKEHITTSSSLIIGDVVHPKSPGGLPRYDWALFDATKLGFEDNTTNQNSVTVVQASEFPDTGTVVSIRTSRGELAGTLSSSASGIMLNADQGFVQVRTIVMDKGNLFSIDPAMANISRRISSVSYLSRDRFGT
ncbi:hypothetical protein F5883DRAFT_107572 [Diaporthe sp. PMI_573]|nr:hypothetical protein F5883DRAFT_107572 [Diaporthaceae sp. PMI_573]